MILLLCSIMLFAFPMAQLLYDNDQYVSAEKIREMDDIKGLELYTSDNGISPEFIFDLGEPLKRVTSAYELPQQGKFGFLAYEAIPEEIQNNFEMKFIVQFDINNRKEGTSSHKLRKTSKLFVVEKK